jgi:RNA-splicing ligase RtcB
MRERLKDLARDQLGTIGGGNHYVDILVDERDRVWIGVHFGSRGLGFKTATWFLEKGGAKDGMDVDPLVIPANSALGADYLACMHLAGRYAYAGRDWVCAETARLLGWKILEEVHNHHNFAWRETHGLGMCLYLAELDGFVVVEDRALARFKAALRERVIRVARLGGYGIPLTAEDLAVVPEEPAPAAVPSQPSLRRTRKRRT